MFFGLRKPKSVKHRGQRLSDILEAHVKFAKRAPGGVCADLSGADLSRCDLRAQNLTDAILQGANLEGSDLRAAKLTRANFSGATLRQADLRNCDIDRKSTRLNSSHIQKSRMPSSA